MTLSKDLLSVKVVLPSPSIKEGNDERSHTRLLGVPRTLGVNIPFHGRSHKPRLNGRPEERTEVVQRTLR